VSDRIVKRLSVDREARVHSGKCDKSVAKALDCGARVSERDVMEADRQLKKKSRSQ
jgi:hypothetical protein